jgi:membrane-bound serine protease (ClpP class)
MKSATDVMFIAHVEHQAMSAAAIISLACKHIYMTNGSSIGASVPFKVGPNGTPMDVEQKFFSAVESEMRGAAEMGGHSPLFVRGMSELDVELVMRHEGARPVIALAEPGKEKPGEKIIKPRGRILTMTAMEAMDDGLTGGVLGDVAEIRRGLGIAEWHRVAQGATDYLKHRAVQAAETHAEMVAGKIADRLEELRAKHDEVQAKMAELQKGEDDETNAVKAEYLKALDEQHAPQDLDKYTQQAKDKASTKVAAIKGKYDPPLASAAEELRAVTAEETVLNGMKGQLEAR